MFLKVAQNSKLVEVFSCEFCEIFKNTCFYRTPLVAAFGNCNLEIYSLYSEAIYRYDFQCLEGHLTWTLSKNVNSFQKKLNRRCLTRSWIGYWLMSVCLATHTTLSLSLSLSLSENPKTISLNIEQQQCQVDYC